MLTNYFDNLKSITAFYNIPWKKKPSKIKMKHWNKENGLNIKLA